MTLTIPQIMILLGVFSGKKNKPTTETIKDFNKLHALELLTQKDGVSLCTQKGEEMIKKIIEVTEC